MNLNIIAVITDQLISSTQTGADLAASYPFPHLSVLRVLQRHSFLGGENEMYLLIYMHIWVGLMLIKNDCKAET